MLISIIIPIYNVERYLRKCLDSVINQTYKNIEVLLINDGSTDNSQKIVDEYVKKDKRFKSFIKKNGGLSDARNFGIQKATGKYFLLVDSDDTIEKNTVNDLANTVKNNDFDLVIFDINCIQKNKIINLVGLNKKTKDMNRNYLISMISACNKLYKLDFFYDNKIEFKKGIYYEDLDLMPQLLVYKPKIEYINNAYYNYIKRESSITTQKKYNEHFEDIFYIIPNIIKCFKDNNVYEQYYEEIEYLVIMKYLINGSLRFIPFIKKHKLISDIIDYVKKEFPKWKNNQYFRKEGLNYRIMSRLVYYKLYFLINLYKRVKS